MKTIKQSFSGNLALALVLALSVAFTSSPAQAADVYLRAQQFIKNVRDGSGTNGNGRARIRMWGYRECDLNFQNCGPVRSPGPVIRVPAGDTSLSIHVQNRLPTTLVNITNETSVYVPGLPKPLTAVRWTGTGDPARDGRVYSFDAVTPRTPNSASIGTYTWNDLRPGTFLYHSGTHPQIQVQMGLYGAIVVEGPAGEAYPGVPYDRDAVLVFSEIDPAIHDAVDNDTYGTALGPTSTEYYQPRFFLINGQSFFAANSPPLVTAAAGENILLRMVNAGIENHSPQLLGGYFDVIAEDANVAPTRRSRHSILLPAAKTRDLLFQPTVSATHVLFDRHMRLANDTGQNGGMFGRIRVGIAGSGGTGNGIPGAGNAPIASDDVFFITSANGRINTGAPGILANDTDPNGDPLRVTPPLATIRATLSGPAGATLSVVTGTNPATAGRVVFDPTDVDWVGVATFQYSVTENFPGVLLANQLVSNVANVTIVRDLDMTSTLFHNQAGTANDFWDLAGATRGAASVTITYVQNIANTNCTRVGNVIAVAATNPDGTWSFAASEANPGGCNRIQLAATIPAADGVVGHDAVIETNFQRVNP